jgi:hypothetical protein
MVATTITSEPERTWSDWSFRAEAVTKTYNRTLRGLIGVAASVWALGRRG